MPQGIERLLQVKGVGKATLAVLSDAGYADLDDIATDNVVECYARNEHLGFLIPYEFQGSDHQYLPDFLIRIHPTLHVVLEIKGDEDARARHEAAKRCAEAVSNCGEMGQWRFNICRDPQLLRHELMELV